MRNTKFKSRGDRPKRWRVDRTKDRRSLIANRTSASPRMIEEALVLTAEVEGAEVDSASKAGVVVAVEKHSEEVALEEEGEVAAAVPSESK